MKNLKFILVIILAATIIAVSLTSRPTTKNQNRIRSTPALSAA